MILPMFTAKIFRKKVYLVIAGSSVLTLYYDDLVNCLKLLTYINCLLSYKISLYSKKLISEWKLNQWENKIIIAQHSFMDSKNFSLIKKYNDRTNKIGFVGRLSEEKGIWDFMFSLEYIIKKQHDITFLIIGDGLLRKKIEEYTKKNELQSYIKFEGWVFHDELPQYLNQLRLLVIPSYTEGLPNVMLEAMACGTPVLATPVGAIPDIIKDGITGFIMGDNSPECIGKNVIRAINSHELAVIVANGRRVVEEIYTFDKAVEQWKEIFKKV